LLYDELIAFVQGGQKYEKIGLGAPGSGDDVVKPAVIHLGQNVFELVSTVVVAPPKVKIRPGIVTDQLVILAFGKAFHLAEGQDVVSAFVVIQKPLEEFYSWDFHSRVIWSGLAFCFMYI
jgi:hypothetical protein